MTIRRTTPHPCTDDCPCAEGAIWDAELAREFPETDDRLADYAAADEVFGRWAS